MSIKKMSTKALVWLPSVMISLFFVLNASEKILRPGELDKVITNEAMLITIGIIIWIAVILFLYNKTIIWGAFILTCYTAVVVFIHLYKGKSYEVLLLIMAATVFAAYIRTPKLFQQ